MSVSPTGGRSTPVECPISEEEVHSPVFFSPRGANTSLEACCPNGHFHPEVAVGLVAHSLDKEEEMKCPFCTQEIEGMYLIQEGVGSMHPEADYTPPASPRVRQIASVVRGRFESSLRLEEENGVPKRAIYSLSADDIKNLVAQEGIKAAALPAPAEPQQQSDDECVFDCRHAGPVAVVAGIVFGLIALAKWAVAPAAGEQNSSRKNRPIGGKIPMSPYYLNGKA